MTVARIGGAVLAVIAIGCGKASDDGPVVVAIDQLVPFGEGIIHRALTNDHGETFFIVTHRGSDTPVVCRLAGASLECRVVGPDVELLAAGDGGEAVIEVGDFHRHTFAFQRAISGAVLRAAGPVPLVGDLYALLDDGVVWPDGTAIGCGPSVFRVPHDGSAASLAEPSECKFDGATALLRTFDHGELRDQLASTNAAGLGTMIDLKSLGAKNDSVQRFCRSGAIVGVVMRVADASSAYRVVRIDLARDRAMASSELFFGLEPLLWCRGDAVTAASAELSTGLAGQRCDAGGCRAIPPVAIGDLNYVVPAIDDDAVVIVGTSMKDQRFNVAGTTGTRPYTTRPKVLIDFQATAFPGGTLIMSRDGLVVLDAHGAPVTLALTWHGDAPTWARAVQ